MSKSRLFPPMWFWMSVSLCLLVYLIWAFWPAWYVPATGVAAAIVVRNIQERRALRKSMVAARALLEPQLDALIALAERTGGDGFKLEEIVRYNTTRVYGEKSHRNIQMHDGTVRYELDIRKALAGPEPCTVNVGLTVCGPGDDAVHFVHWPDRFVDRAPEPWLAERLEKLTNIIGNASAYETRRMMLADRDFVIARRT